MNKEQVINKQTFHSGNNEKFNINRTHIHMDRFSWRNQFHGSLAEVSGSRHNARIGTGNRQIGFRGTQQDGMDLLDNHFFEPADKQAKPVQRDKSLTDCIGGHRGVAIVLAAAGTFRPRRNAYPTAGHFIQLVRALLLHLD